MRVGVKVPYALLRCLILGISHRVLLLGHIWACCLLMGDGVWTKWTFCVIDVVAYSD